MENIVTIQVCVDPEFLGLRCNYYRVVPSARGLGCVDLNVECSIDNLGLNLKSTDTTETPIIPEFPIIPETGKAGGRGSTGHRTQSDASF